MSVVAEITKPKRKLPGEGLRNGLQVRRAALPKGNSSNIPLSQNTAGNSFDQGPEFNTRQFSVQISAKDAKKTQKTEAVIPIDEPLLDETPVFSINPDNVKPQFLDTGNEEITRAPHFTRNVLSDGNKQKSLLSDTGSKLMPRKVQQAYFVLKTGLGNGKYDFLNQEQVQLIKNLDASINKSLNSQKREEVLAKKINLLQGFASDYLQRRIVNFGKKKALLPKKQRQEITLGSLEPELKHFASLIQQSHGHAKALIDSRFNKQKFLANLQNNLLILPSNSRFSRVIAAVKSKLMPERAAIDKASDSLTVEANLLISEALKAKGLQQFRTIKSPNKSLNNNDAAWLSVVVKHISDSVFREAVKNRALALLTTAAGNAVDFNKVAEMAADVKQQSIDEEHKKIVREIIKESSMQLESGISPKTIQNNINDIAKEMNFSPELNSLAKKAVNSVIN